MVVWIVVVFVVRGVVRVEVGEEMENVVVEKNCEIIRLWDKLYYYEFVN